MDLNHLLKLDLHFSNSMTIHKGKFGSKTFQLLLFVFKMLEWSCHGIPWLVGITLLIYMSSGEIRQLFINIFLFLILDLIVIATLKLTFKRSRPYYNQDDMPLSVSQLDAYSFPSGHTTRAFMLLTLFLSYGVSHIQKWLLIIWTFAVAVSRVMLGRHHILDVVIGAFVGIVEVHLCNFIFVFVVPHKYDII